MTRKRQRILAILEQERQPLNSSQVHEKMGASADLATVYRGLQYLESCEFIKSFVFDCQDRGIERYYIVNGERHRHFLHCQLCHRFVEFETCPYELISGNIEREYGFLVEEHYLTLKGRCSACR